TLGGVIASRAYGDAAAGAALGGYALPYAFVGGALLVATGDPVGIVPLVRWIGAPEALVGSVTLLLFAISGLAGIAAGLRVFAAGVTVGVLGAGAALAGFFLPASGAAAILISVLVCGIGVVPLLAIRFGKLPMPPITLPTGAEAAEGFTAAGGGASDGVRERPDRSRVAAAVARTEELLTGMLIGHAVLAIVAIVMLVMVGGLAGWLLVAVSAGALLLRSRLYVTVRQRVPLITAGLTGFGALGIALAVEAEAMGLLGLSVGGLVIALMTIAAGATYSRRPPSPYLGRAADVLDTLMVVAVVPVACAVLGLYGRARGLLG
ncbi:MAG: type VII secretion integral membrane protein EccD, partial [Actinobacteria bacterium]